MRDRQAAPDRSVDFIMGSVATKRLVGVEIRSATGRSSEDVGDLAPCCLSSIKRPEIQMLLVS